MVFGMDTEPVGVFRLRFGLDVEGRQGLVPLAFAATLDLCRPMAGGVC